VQREKVLSKVRMIQGVVIGNLVKAEKNEFTSS
jgi:hypothetical protein